MQLRKELQLFFFGRAISIYGRFGPPIANRRFIWPFGYFGNGKSYILVMTDSFTKYVEMAAIPNQEAKSVMDALMDTWSKMLQLS